MQIMEAETLSMLLGNYIHLCFHLLRPTYWQRRPSQRAAYFTNSTDNFNNCLKLPASLHDLMVNFCAYLSTNQNTFKVENLFNF